MPTTQPVLGTLSGTHYGTYSGANVIMEPGGRKATASPARLWGHNGSFLLFDVGPISAGIFRCQVAFKCGDIRSSCEHIGVMPASSAKAAVAQNLYTSGFAHNSIKGWGYGDKVVKAGVPTDNPSNWGLLGKTVEMVLDADAGTLRLSTAGEADILIEDVKVPVIPAIYLYNFQCELTLLSSSYETSDCATKVALRQHAAHFDAEHNALEQQISKQQGKVDALEQRAAEQDGMMTRQSEAVDERMRALEERMLEKVANLEQQLVDRDQKVLALELRIANQDEKFSDFVAQTAKLGEELGRHADGFIALEARLFKQSADELALASTFADAKAALEKHEANMAALEGLAANGAQGMDAAIAAGRQNLTESQVRTAELQLQLDALSHKLATARATMGDTHTPLEEALNVVRGNSQSYQQEVDLKLKALKMEVLEAAVRTIKQPLNDVLAGLVVDVGEINRCLSTS